MDAPQTNDANYGDAIEPIAIVGISCRFPGQVSSPDQFWDMLVHGRSGHCEVPTDRFHADTWRHPDHDRKGAIQPNSGFFLREDISLFDAPFFSITAKEAMGMDPMQRQLLEVAYECFENAGVPMEKLPGSLTSVYTGVMTNDYERLSQSDVFNLPQNAASGTSRAMLSNRLSWFFDLAGPSLTLDTACSSSLYALHLACQSIRLGESHQALIAGVNLILHPNFISQLSSMHMLSPDGISHSFDDRANGYARGEAVGALFIKPLSQALADGDTIRAVIRGSGANQDGKTPGITMPSPEAQANLIKRTYSSAGLSLADTSYFEAHGTGTKIGDPIELSAIGASFGSARSHDNPLYVGSVKTNIGHTEGMAGLAGVIKATLSLENAVLPGLVGFEKLNPKLLLQDWKLALPLETMPWPVKGLRRASVNSFGFGGANAHVILDDVYHYLESHGLRGRHRTIKSPASPKSNNQTETARSEPTSDHDYQLLPFSTHDLGGLDRLSKTLAGYLATDPATGKPPEIDMADLAFTLATHRSQFSFRSYAVSRSVQDLASKDVQEISNNKQKRRGQPENVIFVFTGQGAQWPLMGQELLKQPVFRASVVKSQGYLDELGCRWSAADLLRDPSTRINIAEHCQPICTVLQVALVDLLASWGVTAKATVGHSSGEIAAAYAAGGINHKDAVKIAYMRGYYCGQIQPRLKEKRGAMLAAGLTVQEAQQYLELVAEGSVVIGCVNSPASVTLSGDYDGISYLEQRIKLDGKFSRKLRVEVAYHSPHMDTVSQDFLESLGTIQTSPTFTASMFSSVTTEKLDTPDELNATYWVTNMVSAVRFSDAVNTLLSHSEVTARSKRKAPVNWLAAIELGPHEALKGPFNQCASAVGAQRRQASIPYTSLVRRGEPADKTAAQAAGLLWALGYPVDIPSVNNVDESRKKTLQTLTCLPPYPWQHSKGFWHEPIASVSTRLSTFPRTDLLGVAVENQNPHEAQWKNVLRLSENPWMRDHTITGTVLYPAAGMLIMAFEGALQMAATKQLPVLGIEFHDVQFDRGLVVPDNDDGVETLLSLRSHETLESWFHWAVYSQPTGGRWTKHSFGLLAIVEGADDATNPRWRSEGERLASVKARSTRSIDPDGFYHQLESIGMGYGPCFTNLTAAGAIDGEQTGHGVVAIPDTKSTMPFHFEYPHVIHPATLDAIFHLIFVALFEGQPMIEAAIPVTVERLFISADQPAGTGAEFVGISNGRKINERDSSGSLVVSDSNWSSVKITVTNMVVRKVSSPSATIDISTGESMVDTLPKRVGEMRWMEDLDLLDLETTNKVVEQTAEKLSGLAPHVKLASAWLSHTCHKYANLHACAVADSLLAADSVAEFVSQFAPAPPYESCLSKVLVIATSDDVHHYLADRLRHKATTASYDLITPDGFKTMFQNEAIKPFDIVLVHCTEQRPLDESLLGWGSHVKTSGKILVLGGRTTEVQSLQDLGFGMIMASVARTDVSFLVAGRSPTEVRRRENATIYVLQSPKCSSKVIRFRQLLDQAFAIDNITLVTKQLGEIKTLVGQTVISLLEIEEPLVICWTEEQFQHFCDLVSSQSYVLWVTRGGALEKGERSLQFAPTTGLLRTIRTEMPQVSLPHLDLSPSLNLEDVSASNMIRTVFDATALESEGIETEFVELSGTLFIPRVVSNVSLDGELNAHSENPSPVPALLSSEQENPLRLAGAESLDSLNQSYWTADSKVGLAIGDDEVEIKTESVALESTHLSTKSTSQNALNLRAASGIVTRLGADVHQFAIGDHVFFPLFQHETLRTRMNQQKQLLRKLPAGIRVDVVLLLSTSLMAAYHSLHNVARVAAGESVLIHLQNGELAQAALHIAKKAGTKVFMAVSSASERDTFMHRYHVAQHRIFDHASNGTNMIQTLMDATSGRGFDVIVSDHRGESRRQSTSCIAESGRFVDLSRNMRISDMNGDFFERNASISSVDLWSLSQPKLESVFAAASAILHQDAFLDLHSTAPQFTVADLQSASAYLDQTANATATVYFDNDALIPIIPVKPASPDLSPKATYIIAGGLGALGLTIAENMVTHGARHLVLLSRSGITNTRQQTSVDELRQRGCVVDTLPCDVTDEDQVKSLVELGQNRGWSVKGLIQCAMVLRDSILENMTFDKWLGATQPKIKGTWNLHTYLPLDLDFFIILSSMSGIIGNAAQANYAAGNTYEDAVAHYRRAHGLAATTLNVGLVTDASHFSAEATIEDYLKRYGHWASATVTDSEMQAVIEAVMRGNAQDVHNPLPAQLLVGINGEVPRSEDGLNPWSKDRKFDHRVQKQYALTESANGTARSLAEILKVAESGHEAAAAIEHALRSHVAAAMTASPEDIDGEKPLYSFGIDSLKAIQVRNWVMKELKCDVSVFDILSPMPLVQLAVNLARRSSLVRPELAASIEQE